MKVKGNKNTNVILLNGKIYWAIHTLSVMLLIPKKKGIGFLKTPVGHHNDNLSLLITNLGYDCCGLDGYLNINTGFTYGQDFTILIREISTFYKKEAIQVSADKILDWLISNNK